MSRELKANAVDVLPRGVNQLLGGLWILLFAGRWIATPFLLAAGLVTPAMVADADERILLRLYLALLSVTILVVALRTMRAARLGSAGLDVSVTKQNPDTAGSAPGVAAERKAESP